MSDKTLYAVATSAYERWNPDEKTAIEDFLRAHDIDPTDVPLGSGNEIVVKRLEGSDERRLSVWVYDEVDGRAVRCPNCPGCAKAKLISRPLKTAPPQVRWASFTFDTVAPTP